MLYDLLTSLFYGYLIIGCLIGIICLCFDEDDKSPKELLVMLLLATIGWWFVIYLFWEKLKHKKELDIDDDFGV